MKRTFPIASQPAALASTFPPTSNNVVTIPSDISTFMTVLLFAGRLYESTLYSRKTRQHRGVVAFGQSTASDEADVDLQLSELEPGHQLACSLESGSTRAQGSPS